MKFSYQLLKQLVPELQGVDQLIAALTMHAFEVDSVAGDTVDIKILPNRYSDAGSHRGMAREIAAILGTKAVLPKIKDPKSCTMGGVRLEMQVPKESCTRMMVRYFDGIKIAPSPEWMQRALLSCGMRPINNLIDITNYVTLETGQPLHALDFQKMEGGKLAVRFAQGNEPVELLDGAKFALDGETMVLADARDPLDIAGIKGGRKAEITEKTTSILLTAANFDGPSIYKASKKYGVTTDASARFAHHIANALIPEAIARASELLVELCSASAGEEIDAQQIRERPTILKFDHDEFAKLTGMKMAKAKALGYLKALGFVVKENMVTAPAARTDIERFEDLVDEIVRLVGYDALPATPPHVSLRTSTHDDMVTQKELIRAAMMRLPFYEVYNYSFVKTGGVSAVPLQNPVSGDFAYLRTDLATHLAENINEHLKHRDETHIFEIGHVFEWVNDGVNECAAFALAIGKKSSAPLAECKGIVTAVLKQLGIVDAAIVPNEKSMLRVMSGSATLGTMQILPTRSVKYGVVAEFDMNALRAAIEGEREYVALVKYPAVVRDVSMVVAAGTQIGAMQEAMQAINTALIEDVDLIDYFDDEKKIGAGKKSLAFRIIFQSQERTLTDDEVSAMMKEITDVLQQRFAATIR